MPIFDSPKSNARIVIGAANARLRAAGLSRHQLEVDAERRCGLIHSLGVRHVEEHFEIRRAREPGVLRELVLELTTCPTGIAERNEITCRAGTRSDCLQSLLRSRQCEPVTERDARVEPRIFRVQHETVLASYRTPFEHGIFELYEHIHA